MFEETCDGQTHSVCKVRLEVEGGKATCCICNPHLGCSLKEDKTQNKRICTECGEEVVDGTECHGNKEAQNSEYDDQGVSSCPDCGYEEGHSPECKSKQGRLYREVSELLSGVYAGKYGTKNGATLILKLQSIKSML